MKTLVKSTILYLILSAFYSCSNDDDGKQKDNELIGSWKVIEYYADPGDGSGTFIPADYEKNINFIDDDTLVIVNGNMCFIGSSGEYGTIELSYRIEGEEIVTEDCSVLFSIEDNALFLSYLCFEGCVEKFTK